MQTSTSKKSNLKLQLNKKSLENLTKDKKIVPSSKCSQKTVSSRNTTSCTSSSSKNTFQMKEQKTNINTPEDKTKYELIEYLLKENQELQQQNQDKDQLITILSCNKSPKKRSILTQERNSDFKSQKLPLINPTKNSLEINNLNDAITNSPFCFTFCKQDTQSAKSVRNKKLPVEFQCVPNQKRYFI